MKFNAPNNARSKLIAVLFTTVVAVTSGWSDNICQCQNPPGGSVRCEAGQVPICRVKNGFVFAECKTPPRSAKSGNAFTLWFASQLLQKKLQPDDLYRYDVQNVLKSGVAHGPSGEVTRSMSLDSRMAIQQGEPKAPLD
jgi:hypothetical protein